MSTIIKILMPFCLIFLCSCTSISWEGKKSEIVRSYEQWIKTTDSNVIHLDYKLRNCGGICSGSKTSKFYMRIFTNACSGRVNIEERCSEENNCSYSFHEEEIMICS